MVGIGSIVELVLQANIDHPCWVWGTGFMMDGPNVWSKQLNVCALRGKSSAARYSHALGQFQKTVDIPMGDPGLLCNFLLPESNTEKSYAVGIIPHFIDQNTTQIDEMKKIPHASVIYPSYLKMRFLTSHLDGIFERFWFAKRLK